MQEINSKYFSYTEKKVKQKTCKAVLHMAILGHRAIVNR
jgi:hypothetical protein